MAELRKTGTVILPRAVYAVGWGNAVGKAEAEGPLGGRFDKVYEDEYCGTESFEQAEGVLQQVALDRALERAGMAEQSLSVLAAGDLLNQCVASGYHASGRQVPFIGLYGACSTMALSLCTVSLALCAGVGSHGGAVTGSHFCSAERQFRYPLEYGATRPPSAQRTVTGAGGVILSTEQESPVRLRAMQLGRVIDYGVTDIANMGAAMAPAAVDTIQAYLENTGQEASDFDAIVTGDLGQIGSEIFVELAGLDPQRHFDCGKMIFDAGQDVHAGGSGCGCSAAVLTAHFLPRLAAEELGRVLFMATGALMSPLTVQQGQSIPAVAHLVEFSGRGIK